MKAATAKTEDAPAAPSTTTTAAPPASSIKETTEARLPEKETDNAGRPLAVTAPAARVEDLPVNTPAGPPTLETMSIPAQITREQIASGKPVEPPVMPQHAAGRGGRGQRVVGAARDVVEERIGPRVEKLRQASNVVWGEAQDDPNLRFILIAVFLFIIATVIILLGTYLR